MKKLLILLILLFIPLGCATSNEEHGQHQTEEENNHANHEEKDEETVQIEWEIPENYQPNREETVTFQVKDTEGNPIEDFEIVHEKELHLIIASQDLDHFRHVHPTNQGEGKFEVDVNLPKAGTYQLFADFKPQGMEETVQKHVFTVEGEVEQATPLQPTEEWQEVVDGKEVTLTFNRDIKANEDLMMTFELKDEQSGQPITNLQPYLGETGHVVILSEDAEQYLHVHPMGGVTAGPKAEFHTTFPHAGIFKIWAEFQQEGKVFVTSFVVEVKE